MVGWGGGELIGKTSTFLSDYFLISYYSNLCEGGKLKSNKIRNLCST